MRHGFFGCFLGWRATIAVRNDREGLVALVLTLQEIRMKTVEISYRYWSPAPTRPRPHDAEAARLRLSEGNHAFATLLDSLSEGAGLARRVIDVDPRDLGLLQGRTTHRRSTLLVVLGCSDARVPIELISLTRDQTTCLSSGLLATALATMSSVACGTPSNTCAKACGSL